MDALQDFYVSFTDEDSIDYALEQQLAGYTRLNDLRIFDVEDCSDLVHCTVSSADRDDKDRYI